MNLPDGFSMERYAALDHGRIRATLDGWHAFAESCLQTWAVPDSRAELIALDYRCDFMEPSLFDGRTESPPRRATCDDPRYELRMIRRSPGGTDRVESIAVRLSELDSRHPEVTGFIVAAAGTLSRPAD